MKRAGVVEWPRDVVDRYTASGVWRQQALGNWVWSWAESYGHRTAVVDGVNRFSYWDLARRVDSLAECLFTHGLRDGDNLLMQLPNCWEFLGLFLACQRIGVAPLLALPAHRDHELAYLADLANVSAIAAPHALRGFDHESLAARIAARCQRDCLVLIAGGEPGPGHLDLSEMLTARPGAAERRDRLDAMAPSPGDVAFFLLSGGTTGLPKIIPRTHNDYMYNVGRSAEVCEFNSGTVYLAVLPLAHNFALGSPGALGALSVGGRVVMCPSPQAKLAFPELARERATVTSVVPAIARTWLDEATTTSAADLDSLRVLQVGGSVLPNDLARELGTTFGCTLQQVFGMAEGLLNYTRLTDPPSVITGTQGRPISEADEILIIGQDGRPVQEGETGELLTRGPYTVRGYFRAAEHNSRAYTEDGWYRTGDLVHRRSGGNLVVEGRLKDVVNRGGEKISIDEVEDLVRSVPGIADVAAVALPDPVMGESVGVCVVPEAGAEPTLVEIHTVFRSLGVAAFKYPDAIRLSTRLPLTPIGKVDRKRLLQRFTRSSDRTATGLSDGPSMSTDTMREEAPVMTSPTFSEEAPLPPELAAIRLKGVDHLAWVTWKPDETVRFYRDVLGLPLVHAITATGWVSDTFPDFVHFFFALGNGDHLAFFYYFGLEEEDLPTDLMHRSRHLALHVDTEEELFAWRKRLKAKGVRVTPPLAHELLESIYFDDPNGIQLEITRPLRPFAAIDARDAELTLRALADITRDHKPTVEQMWRRKGELSRIDFERSKA